MCYLIEEDQLNILNFNRLVKHLNGFTVDQFIKKIKKKHSVSHKKQNIYSPTLKNEISMYIDGKWYSIVTSNKRYSSTSESLDPSILSKDILNPILNIIDERIDKNISFMDGTIPLSTLKEKVDSEEYRFIYTKTYSYRFDKESSRQE